MVGLGVAINFEKGTTMTKQATYHFHRSTLAMHVASRVAANLKRELLVDGPMVNREDVQMMRDNRRTVEGR